MSTVVVALFAVLGLLVGSFSNVVIARVPEGKSVVAPRSACPACGHQIRALDNVPVLSWVLLRARCRDCSAPISAQYPAVEALTAVLFACIPVVVTNPWAWPAATWVTFLAVALSGIDLKVHRLPFVLSGSGFAVLVALLALASAGAHDWAPFVTAVQGAVALTAFFGTIRVVWGSGIGLGDVVLAPLVGTALGWYGWPAVAVGTFAMFLLGAVVGVAARIRDNAKGIPFGPFMFAGLGMAVCVGGPVWAWYLRVIGA